MYFETVRMILQSRFYRTKNAPKWNKAKFYDNFKKERLFSENM